LEKYPATIHFCNQNNSCDRTLAFEKNIVEGSKTYYLLGGKYPAIVYFWNQKNNSCDIHETIAFKKKKFQLFEHPGRLLDLLFVGRVFSNSTFLEPE
jgi:hypothetical protein